MTKTNIQVVKRNGIKEEMNLDKIHNIIQKACEGITGVSVSEIALKANLSLYDGISTKEIHSALIKSAADLISEDAVNYQYVAGNLLNYELRKTAWGGMEPPRLFDHVNRMTELGYYHEDLLSFYTEADFDKMDAFIDHDRDYRMTYIGLNEYMTKYAVQDRSLKTVTPLETPQITYMLIAAIAAHDTKSIKDVKKYYNDYSLWNLSLPTPIMAGVRTPTKQYSSCCLISSGDNLNSIRETNSAIIAYSAKRAGIGVDASRIRAEGSPVGKERAIKHTGVIPFLRSFEGALKSSAQGGLRGSSATCTLCLWHLEVLDLLVLKNNKGTPDNRVRKMDYSFQINNYLYNRFIDDKPITLFSASEHEVPGLYDAYFADPKKFKELYEKYESDPSIRKKSVDSRELFASLATERKETGRIYVFNVDNVNEYSTFKVPITTSNLCQEITLPTTPMATIDTIEVDIEPQDFIEWYKIQSDKHNIGKITINVNDDKISAKVPVDNSEIALCTLMALNLGNIRNLDDLESICRNAVRSLDNLLDYQDYMVPAAKTNTLNYRPLGISVTNLAYYLAKNNLRYSDKAAYELIHETMEAISFYCIKASIELAKERGPCLAYHNTKWADGLLPIHRYNPTVDEIVEPKYKLDWKWLEEQLRMYGIRNATLLCNAPIESSSRVYNSTNGVEPVRSLITTKSNKSHISRQVVPEYSRLKNRYDLLWEMKDMDGIIKMMAVMQKFICQSISTNLSYNPQHYENGEIPMSVLLGDILKANYHGLKTLYYHNTRDGAEDTLEMIDKPTEDVVEPVTTDSEEPHCDSCAI